MKEIKLTQGKVALVDDTDYERISQHGWYANFQRGRWYAMRRKSVSEGSGWAYMHREIMSAPKESEVDHCNGNCLDNQKSNLRLATHADNQHNRKTQRNNTSGYKGVIWHVTNKNWVARIVINGKKQHIGSFQSKHDAAKAYNEFALQTFGQFARLNKIEGENNERE